MPTADMKLHLHRAWLRLASIALCVAACAYAATARAENHCVHVERVPIVTTTIACTESPLGVCTVGAIGSGPLAGTTRFVVLTDVVRGMAEFFTGLFTVTTECGTVTFASHGVVNLVTGKFQEQFKALEGTGCFEDVSGTLVSHGVTTATGFSGTLMGVICTPEPLPCP